MPGSTPIYGFPYPLGTDPVRDGDNVIRSLAEDVETEINSLNNTLYAAPAPRNLFYNGAMQVQQRGTSATSLTTGGYRTADRWRTFISGIGTWTETVENDAPSGSGFRKSWKILCTTAKSSLAGADQMQFRQLLEGQDLQVIKKGTSDAQPLRVSFWVKSNVIGTYILEIQDVFGTRMVQQAYTISVSDVWEFKTLLIPADTVVPFDNNNLVGMQVSFWLGAGSNFTSGTLQTTWGFIVASNRAVGQVNLASAVNNYWQVTGLQMTVGAEERPFEFKSFGQELRECQRYYMRWVTSNAAGRLGMGSAVATGVGNFLLPYKVQPRTTLGTFSVGGSLGMSDGASAPFAVFVASRLDVVCSDGYYGVSCTGSGMTQFRPMYLEAVSSSTTAFVASDMEL
jgi:hypothetical protein